jgi:hypothetical protein
MALKYLNKMWTKRVLKFLLFKNINKQESMVFRILSKKAKSKSFIKFNCEIYDKTSFLKVVTNNPNPHGSKAKTKLTAFG